MGDMLSQAELDALLGGMLADADNAAPEQEEAPAPPLPLTKGEIVDRAEEVFTPDQCDALGEIGNISMGTASTTLFALLNQKVTITTPKVRVLDWGSLSNSYDRPCVGIRVDYRAGLKGSNILILKDRDVKIIADLMMGGTGDIVDPFELNEIDMSAIGEAMNQMVGSSATSLSSMIKEKVDINTPMPFMLEFQKDDFLKTVEFAPDELLACVSFRMEIGTLIDSEIMQILPIDFARDMVVKLQGDMMGTSAPAAAAPPPPPAPAPQPVTPPPQPAAPPPQQAPPPQPMYAPPPDYGAPQPQPMYYAPPPQQYAAPPPPHQFAPPPNVQPAAFQPLDYNAVFQQKENMGIIMDVPLEITVELGRTTKSIQDILEFSPGTVITLDRMAGEPIDILVNGKFVAKGEVVVIDENFGIRITDIVSVEKRI
ncbi:MAG: flagellar motor switch phosphatase FliY [Defluviitaleaceae bacterium]|nr:flagellar motor switch phosphatase FliY [Defluviitaleaceae bacterium]